jgi:hypothetical protein
MKINFFDIYFFILVIHGKRRNKATMNYRMHAAENSGIGCASIFLSENDLLNMIFSLKSFY